MADYPDNLPREHRVRSRLETLLAHHLGHPRNLVVEQRYECLRRDVARPETGASREDDDVCGQGAFAHRHADLFGFVRHALADDHISWEQREARHDNVATAVIGIDAAAAVADGDLGSTPALLRGHFTHSRMSEMTAEKRWRAAEITVSDSRRGVDADDRSGDVIVAR